MESLVIIAAVAMSSLITAILVHAHSTKPLRHLLSAVTHVSGEPSATTPPRPNDSALEKSGLGVVLQTIYSLASQTAPEDDAVTPAEAPARNVVEAALDSTLCGFITMDEHHAITYANKAAPVRVDSDGIMTLDVIFNGEDTLSAWLTQCAESSVKAEHTWARVANKLPNEEDRRFFDIIASYNKGAKNEVVLVLVDRTQLYSVGEEELDFIAFAAHELRGPITVIRGYLDVFQDELSDVLQDDQKELFRRLAVSANRLSGYINNILNTSRYDRRHLKMHLAETTVIDVYDTIRDDMALRASSQNRLLTVSIPNDLPTIAADTTSLGEVFGNLIDNAIKYSNEGGAIAVSAALNGDMVDVAIKDHGIGMPGNVVGNLFQKFYRSHRSRETVAGTGIGLYISKAIVESHGGTISVQSEEGRGSTFTVSLPTYRSVADSLRAGDNNDGLLKKSETGVYIKNHSAYRG
ncbi:HAMP domain-containing histidine kinase [Candidatus Saccharibacteria bacterium]|nr:HAMP domain-containing histidine kinase [Candidatus Saccharibacteria bacterium]